MTKAFSALLTVLICLAGRAQSDTIRKYLDADLRFSTKKDFVYPAMAIKRNDHWILFAVYPDTSLLLQVSYKDQALTIKDGPFLLYYPKKIVAREGSYSNNMANGHWITYYSDGRKKDEGDIRNNHLTGFWQSWYPNGLSKINRTYLYTGGDDAPQTVHENSPINSRKVLDEVLYEGPLEGNATTWYQNGMKESEVNYHNDSLSGTCTWYRLNGKPSSREEYHNGVVTDLQCFDSLGMPSGSTCSISKLPVFIHPVFSALDYVEQELHKQRRRNIAEGEVEVSFTVTQLGTVSDLVIQRSPDPALSKLVTQIFAAMPAWSPAVTHNRKIDYKMNMVIPFYQ